MSATLYIDISTMRAVKACDTQAVLRYGLGYTTLGERAALKAGTAVHEALAAYFRTGAPAVALAVLDAVYRDFAEANVAPGDRLAYANVATVLRVWLDRHPLAGFPFTVPPSMVEVGAQAQLTDDGVCACGHADEFHHGGCTLCRCPEFCIVVLVARLDAAARGRDSGWYVLDHKTTSALTSLWLDQFQMDAQMSGYLWLLQQHLGEPVNGAFINGIELPRLPSDPNRKCKSHGVVYAECGSFHARAELVLTQRRPEEIEEWRAEALTLARRFRELTLAVPAITHIDRARMLGKWDRTCGWCEFKPFCQKGRQLELVDAMLTYDPWVPYERLKERKGGDGSVR